MLSPDRVTGDVTDASVVGDWSCRFGVEAASTHQVSSGPSLRTVTVVSGPELVGLTMTSPERTSPCRNRPTTGSTKPRYVVANPRTALTGPE